MFFMTSVLVSEMLEGLQLLEDCFILQNITVFLFQIIDDQMHQALDGIKNIGSVNFNSTADSSLKEFQDSLKLIKFSEINQKVIK